MGYRTLQVDGVEYRYVVGTQYIKIVPPHGSPLITTQAEILGTSDDEIRRARWKGSAYKVTPTMIEEFVREHGCPVSGSGKKETAATPRASGSK